MHHFHGVFVNFIFLILTVMLMTTANARPPQMDENVQLVGDQDTNQMLDSSLKQWQMELLAQRLASELNPIGIGNDGFERSLRSEVDRKRRRFRACYFNPVSCFKK